jgi:ribosomal-protein-alanine N-acetyltransferase
VTVSTVSAGDAGEFVAAAKASRSLHYPWISPPDTRERFAEWNSYLARDDQAGYLIRHTECGALVGYVTVANIVRRAFLSAAMGYGAFEGHAGRGLMKSGLRSVLALVFGELGLHRVEANIQPGNAASIALACRLGFEKEGFSPQFLMIGGEWRDHERWALRAEMFDSAPRDDVPSAPGGRP